MPRYTFSFEFTPALRSAATANSLIVGLQAGQYQVVGAAVPPTHPGLKTCRKRVSRRRAVWRLPPAAGTADPFTLGQDVHAIAATCPGLRRAAPCRTVSKAKTWKR
jgi:hypothetical protein